MEMFEVGSRKQAGSLRHDEGFGALIYPVFMVQRLKTDETLYCIMLNVD